MRKAASFDTIMVGADAGLAEGGADDPVVGQLRVEAVLDQQVLLHAVDLDLHRAGADRYRLGQRATVLDAQVLDRPQRGAGRAADVVGAGLEAVELLDDGERDHERRVAERQRGSADRRSAPTCR